MSNLKFILPTFINRPFPSFPGPLYQNEVKCSAFDMEMIFHSCANKTHFHKKGFALGLILKVRVLELWSGLLRCDAFVFMWWMILDYYYYAFVENANLRLAWLWVDPTILNCADKISNQNGFKAGICTIGINCPFMTRYIYKKKKMSGKIDIAYWF